MRALAWKSRSEVKSMWSRSTKAFTHSHRLYLQTTCFKPRHACAVKPEVPKSCTLEMDYSRAPCLGADQKTRGLWERDCSKFQFNQYRERAWKPAKADVASCLYRITFPELPPPWPAVGKRELWEQPFWNNKGNNRILPIRFTAQSQSAFMACYGACLKWLLPELLFSDRWSRGTKLWERDCSM